MKYSLIICLIYVFLGNSLYGFNQTFDFYDTDFIGDTNFESSYSRANFTPEEILGFVTGVVHWQDLANKDFFLKAHEIPVRHPLDLPFFTPYRFDFVKNQIAISPWYCQIDKLHSSRYNNHLEGYLALNDKTLLDALRDQFQIIQSISDSFYLNTNKIFNVLKDTFIEQRRIGLMGEWVYQYKKWQFLVQVPFVYLERNFQMTDENKKILDQELGFNASLEDQVTFQNKHLISDKIGFSDMRIHCSYSVYDTEALRFKTGLFTSLPTGFRCSKGLKGSIFRRPSIYSDIDLMTIFDELFDTNATVQDASFAPLSNLALDSLDRLSALLLDSSLHNRRHGSLGADCYFEVPFLERNYTIQYNLLLSAEYLFPGYEKRFFINAVDQAGFATLNVNNFSNALNILNFLKKESISRFFLRAFDAKVSPGFILKQKIEGLFLYNKWTFGIGIDGWIKTKEYIALNTTDHLVDKIRSEGFLAYQYGLTGRCCYSLNTNHIDLQCGVSLFATVISRAIGNEYGVVLNFAIGI